MSTEPRARAWVDVSAAALRANFRTIRDTVGGDVRMIPMVKANAYGLGMARTIAALETLAPWGYGVAAVEEGIRVRELGIPRPVVVFSPIPPGSYHQAVDAGLTVSVGSLQGLASLREAALEVGKPGRFHLEVDTGMGRAGFDWHRVEEWAPALGGFLEPPLELEGCFTHFHSADQGDESPTLAQWKRLQDVVRDLASPGEGMMGHPLMVHAWNSPGALRLPGLEGAAARPGIFLYGGRAGEGLPAPAPVASLRARIVFLRDAVRGSTAGYGATYTASGEERWATAAIGYGDGLPRLLGNRGEALVGGRRVPIIGRVSMDLTVLNVTGVPDTELGDVVTFIGREGEEEITVDEVAGHAQTISYEILTDLTPRVPRIWTDDAGY